MHGDLYAHNILIDRDCHTLMGDFGAASFYDHAGAGDAYERLEVRAFGALLEDLLLRVEPHEESLHPEKIRGLWGLVHRCMSEDVQQRPLFSEIGMMLETSAR